MTSLSSLVVDLQAADKAIALIRASPELRPVNLAKGTSRLTSIFLGSSANVHTIIILSPDGPQSEDVLRPIFMGCATKNPKVIAIALGSLQRLISMKAVPQSTAPTIVGIMGDSLSQGVDIQLKVLQALLSLLTNYTDVHDELLGDALLLCFRLQESRIAVVSSTAAATLRQLVMFVFDKVVEADNKYGSGVIVSEASNTELPNGSVVPLHPSAKDAFFVFQDLCLLANSEKARFLKLHALPKTFGLELIESVLTNYHALFRQRPELLMLLRHNLCPLLLKSLSDKPLFPLTLRSTRVVYLLLKQFSAELETEAEVFLMFLIRVVSGDLDSSAGESSGNRPTWMRVLALEILRGICSDAALLRSIWDHYDAHAESGSKVFTSLITAMSRLATEKPALLGVSSQMAGVGITAHAAETNTASAAAYGLEVAGRVASAATAHVSNAVGLMGSDVGLSLGGSSMRLQCIDQLDKADSPIIPESYVYLLALQCLVSISEGMAAYTLPLYTSLSSYRQRGTGDPSPTAPGSLDLNALADTEQHKAQLKTVAAMVERGWPGLLSALSFLLSTNLSDDLFAETLGAYQNVMIVSGALNLITPRDTFLTSLTKFAIPPGVVSSVDAYAEPASSSSKSASVSDALGFSNLSGGPTATPGLSERNLACLKSIVHTASYLSGSLGAKWFDILEVLQNADYVITLRGTKGSTAAKRATMLAPSASAQRQIGRAPSVAGTPTLGGTAESASNIARHPLLTDLDIDTVQSGISRLLDGTRSLDDRAFKDFVAALCRLSREMIGMQAARSPSMTWVESMDDLGSPTVSSSPMSPSLLGASVKSGRRVSGIGMPKAAKAGDYCISKLGQVALQNIHRLLYRDTDIAWDEVTSHLLSVLRDQSTPSTLRVQAAGVLDEILVIVPRNVTTAGALQGDIQQRMFEVLSQQMFLNDTNQAIGLEIRQMALETLRKILQSSAHSLVVGWETIFAMLESACQPLQPDPPTTNPSTPLRGKGLSISTGSPRLPYSVIPPTRSTTALVRSAFQSLTLVCDTLDSLSPDQLQLCIRTLGQFGRQQDTNIALTAAESLMWGVSDSIQANRKDAEKEPVYSALWTSLLLELRGLCADARQEVRFGAIQTMFRTLQLYGATLSLQTWDDCVWNVMLPLLDSLTVSVKEAAAVNAGIEPPSAVSLRENSRTQWGDSKTLALQSISKVLQDFLVSKIMYLETFVQAWDRFVSHITDSTLHDARSISTAALRCLDQGLKATSSTGMNLQGITAGAWERVWEACNVMGDAVKKQSRTPRLGDEDAALGGPLPFTQESLLALVEVIASVYSLSGRGWNLERLARVMQILKAIMTYQSSHDYRPDIDSLTPVQNAVISAIQSMQFDITGAPSILLFDIAEYMTLAFLAAFDFEEPPLSGQTPEKPRPTKHVSYIALSKMCMPLLAGLFSKYKDVTEIYADGTVESMFSSYAIPMKLKYDAPAPSKFGSDQPLWKTATSSFLVVVNTSSNTIDTIGDAISEENLVGFWRQMLDVYRGALLADCSFIESFPIEEQVKEEDFDRSLIRSLQADVVPRVATSRVPDDIIIQLGRTLKISSRLLELDGVANLEDAESGESSESDGKRSVEFAYWDTSTADTLVGTTTTGTPLPRERFSYWCFDLLFLLCSDTVQDHVESRKRIAALILPNLLDRCHSVLASFVADVKLRGSSPLPRVQEEELIYVLRKMLELQLWPGSLWAAFSSSPTVHAKQQPGSEPSLRGHTLVADAIRRSSKAHLYHVYSVLCDIASSSSYHPTVWAEDPKKGVVELNSRQLARQALREIGKEMGVEI
ncbi:hypothetical protein FRB96_008194 [Tulasnella sp. 330]|nr:hypothetical protein FRB96_008194 [Tulasnella sp. 330]